MTVHRICIVTNRNITKNGFGERGNAKGIVEVRIAEAWMNDGGSFTLNPLKESTGEGRHFRSFDL